MVGFPLGAIVGAAGNILGGILGKPKVKERSPADQIKSTVKGAREAGIHPLAALGSGAGYSYSTAGSPIGEGVSRAASILASQKSQAELDALAADTEARRAQADLYRAQSRTLIQRSANKAIGGPPVDTTPNPIRMFGVPITRDPSKFSKAQDAQDEFGDIVEQLVGVPSFVYSTGKEAIKQIPTDREILDKFRRYYDRIKGRDADFGPSP